MRIFAALACLSASAVLAAAEPDVPPPTPQYRPAYHFSPAAHWMNDPNGLVFHDGVYHLFFQYYPDGMTWGPMHWGHATSRDLLRWSEHDIALRPDAHGMIFSGSALVDAANTSGFGRDGRAPLVAVFTHHDAAAERAGSHTFQAQSLAYSLDDGRSWTKYAGNPVLPNPGIRDFRDPKVFWHAPSARWVMSLAAHDRIAFYSSPNLREWTRQGDFGAGAGSHGGTWECPDLFPLTVDGRTRWVLLVSVSEGGPNGGSATQYFIGDFDGHHFTADDTRTRWIDHGPDDYAGVTWSNTGERRLFLGWMSNWAYAKDVPTAPWRSAMTLPRELHLQRVGDALALASAPAIAATDFGPVPVALPTMMRDGQLALDTALRNTRGAFVLRLHAQALHGFTLALGNDAGDTLELGYDEDARAWFVDRRRAGLSAFNPAFAGRHVAPRIATGPASEVLLYFDATSVEVFADGGLSAMTSLFFPRQPYTTMSLRSDRGLVLDRLELQHWQPEAAAVSAR